MKSGSTPYSPALDGLRAFAVVSVVAYHLGLTWLPGGFLGVDLFFVISGFLITSLLVREGGSTGRIRVRAFWARRARRLLPALVLMVAVVCAVALLLGRELDVGLRTQVLGAAVFGSNWLQVASGSSYVDHFEPSLFTHLWSLAVEEQFYFFWPFVVVLLLSFVERRRTRVILVCGLAALSAACMMWSFVPGADPTRVYVGTDTHGFALLMGAALGLALGIRRRRARDPGRPGRQGRPGPERGEDISWWALVGMAGYAVLVAAMMVLSDTGTATFRGGIVVADLGAVAVVGAAASAAGPVGSFFALRLFTWIGRRSYGIYLWHWPAIVIALRVLPRGARAWETAVVAVVVTMLAAEVSWRLLERPIRDHGFRGWLRRLSRLLTGRGIAPPARRRVAWFGVSAFVAVFGLAACGVVVATNTTNLDQQLAAGEQAIAEHQDRPAAQWTSIAQDDVAGTGDVSAVPSPAPGSGSSGESTTATAGSGPSSGAAVTSDAAVVPGDVGATAAPATAGTATAAPSGTAPGNAVSTVNGPTPRGPASTARTGGAAAGQPTTNPARGTPSPSIGAPGSSQPSTSVTAASPDLGSSVSRSTATPVPSTHRGTGTTSGNGTPTPTRPTVSPANRPAQDPATGPVSAIGDSVVLGSAPNMYAAFPSIDIDAKVGRQWWDLPGVISDHLSRGGLGAVVIVGLGTNGSWDAASILKALQPLGARKVVLVTSYENRSWETANNAAVVAAGAARPQTCIADWHTLAAAHPDWIGPDGVHPDPTGRQAYTDLLHRTVSSCR